jgi:magnesium chelatase family protein
MLVKVFGSAVFGVDATTITVEVNIDKGIGYHLVGLPDSAIKESSYRIAAALKNNNYNLPGKKNNHKYGACRFKERRFCL